MNHRPGPHQDIKKDWNSMEGESMAVADSLEGESIAGAAAMKFVTDLVIAP